jgi:hypothetical protein
MATPLVLNILASAVWALTIISVTGLFFSSDQAVKFSFFWIGIVAGILAAFLFYYGSSRKSVGKNIAPK